MKRDFMQPPWIVRVRAWTRNLAVADMQSLLLVVDARAGVLGVATSELHERRDAVVGETIAPGVNAPRTTGGGRRLRYPVGCRSRRFRFEEHVMRVPTVLMLLAGLGLSAGAAPLPAQAPRVERVEFAKGATSTVIEGSITGSQSVDYVVGAAAGQQMNASLATKHGATYFNVLEPGETVVAIFNGSVSDNQFEGTLAKSGDYRLRVYMMRSAARRNEVAKYRLEIIVTGAAKAAAPVR
jgi:hypothetical protein